MAVVRSWLSGARALALGSWVALVLIFAGACIGTGGEHEEPRESALGGAALRASYIRARQLEAGPKYDARVDDGAVRFHNRPHDFVVDFASDGFDLAQGGDDPRWRVTVVVDSFGCPDALARSRVLATSAIGNRVERDHRAFTAWYLNGPLGLEQGFDIPSPPACLDREGSLAVAMSVHGLTPRTRGNAVVFEDDDGEVSLRLDHLYAADANGADVPARLQVDGGRLLIVADARAAAFPVSIDPLWFQDAKLPLGEPTASDSIGSAVAIDGDTAVISAHLDDEAATNAGAAYVFVRNGGNWVKQAKLLAADGDVNDYFGTSVAVSADTVVVSADGDDDGGSAYVFVRNGTSWSQQAKLTAIDAAAGDNFGYAVAISGDTVVVGARFDADFGSNSGSAYVFVRSGTTWSQQAKLNATDAAAGQIFGGAVATQGDSVLVGASGDSATLSAAGAGYVFVRSGSVWSQQAKLTASDQAASDFYGSAVTLHGDTAVLGASGDDDAGSSSGAAYVVVRSGTVWTEQAKLTAGDPAAGDSFGSRVSVDGDLALVGALFDDDAGINSGSAYVFARSGTVWSQQAKLTAADAAATDRFGSGVGLSGSLIVVGADAADDGDTNSGSAYTFAQVGATWSQEAELTASVAGPGDIAGWAVSVSGDTAVVGVPSDDIGGASTAGSALVYVRTPLGWEDQMRLSASDGAEGDKFGSTVGSSGDTVVVGAPGHDAVGSNAGAAYVFVRNGGSWSQQAKLTAADPLTADEFGIAVAVDGDTAVVGAWKEGDLGFNRTGSVYVFVRSGVSWTQQAKLKASDAVSLDELGVSVAISGDTVVAGAHHDDDAGSDAGSAYVFLRTGTTWSQQAQLLASDAAATDLFGASVGASGDSVVVGAYGSDAGASSSGASYVFFRSGGVWTEQAKLVASDAAPFDIAGSAVAIDGDVAVMGAKQDDDQGNTCGAAYVFARSGTTWSQAAKLIGADTTTGDQFGAAVAISGEVVLAGAPFDDDAGPSSGSVYAFIYDEGPLGAACLFDGDCQSTFCRDGVCCNSACGGGVSADCASCLAVQTGLAANGFCAPITVSAAWVCRTGSGDTCDPTELCNGVGTTCPPDVVLPAGAVCRFGAGDACDPSELCSGIPGAGCPADLVAPAGTVCNAGSGDVCDPDQTCSGAAGVGCPPDSVAPMGVVCRAPVDLCDAPETCSGVPDVPCPSDAPQPAGFVCRSATGGCDPAEQCDGASNICPADMLALPGAGGNPSCTPFLCSGNVADCPTSCVDDAGCAAGHYCDGSTCVPLLALGQACSVATACATGHCYDGVCCDATCDGLCVACTSALTGGMEGGCGSITVGTDPEDECITGVCNGNGACALTDGEPCAQPAECVSGFCSAGLCCDAVCAGDCEACNQLGLEGTCTALPAENECRASSNDCDVADLCDGVAPQCPPDAKVPDGAPCDRGTGVCAVGNCEPLGQGGSGAGGGIGGDGGATQSEGGAGNTGGDEVGGGEVGSFVPPNTGCGCRQSAPNRVLPWGWALLLLGVWRRARTTCRQNGGRFNRHRGGHRRA